jgi:hypothetical protein
MLLLLLVLSHSNFDQPREPSVDADHRFTSLKYPHSSAISSTFQMFDQYKTCMHRQFHGIQWEFKKRNWEWNGFDFYGLLRQ